MSTTTGRRLSGEPNRYCQISPRRGPSLRSPAMPLGCPSVKLVLNRAAAIAHPVKARDLFGVLTRQISGRGLAQHGRPAPLLDGRVLVEPLQQLFVKGDLYSFHVDNNTTLEIYRVRWSHPNLPPAVERERRPYGLWIPAFARMTDGGREWLKDERLLVMPDLIGHPGVGDAGERG